MEGPESGELHLSPRTVQTSAIVLRSEKFVHISCRSTGSIACLAYTTGCARE